MSIEDAVRKITSINGAVYKFEDGFVATIPLDSEWMFGYGPNLEDLLVALEQSDGWASEKNGMVIKPYLEFDDAIEEMESFTDGEHEVLTPSQKPASPSF